MPAMWCILWAILLRDMPNVRRQGKGAISLRCVWYLQVTLNNLFITTLFAFVLPCGSVERIMKKDIYLSDFHG